MALNGNPDNTNGYNSVIKNGLTVAPAMIKSVIPPIGSVVAWLKSLTNTPTLPDGWVECNGQSLSDSDSPYNGVTIPNLNASGGGDQRFLVGGTTSGTTGGNLSIAKLYGTGGVTPWDGSYIDNGKRSDTRPPFYTVVWIMRVK